MRYIVIILVLVAMNIGFTGFFKNHTKRINSKTIALEETYSAAHAEYSKLYRERQNLARRERIIEYAQQHLDMQLLKPDVVAQGHIIREVKEELAKNNNIIYCLIDFVTPNLYAN